MTNSSCKTCVLTRSRVAVHQFIRERLYCAAPQAFLPTRSGGIYSFEILTGPACAWKVSGLPTWIHATRASGKGPTPYSLDIAPNEGPPRSATILLNDTPVSIAQSGSE